MPYDVTLRAPIQTAHGSYRQRQGLLLAVHDGGDHLGFGDAAPLPGFSRESMADARARAESLQKEWHTGAAPALSVPATVEDFAAWDETIGAWSGGLPSLRFALETACADLSARRQGLPLARWLHAESADHLEVNAMLDASNPDELARRVSDLWDNGYRTFKLKAGVDSVASDIARIQMLRDTVPEARIRIDVNAAWTAIQLREALPALRDCSPEFIEQPLPIGQALEASVLCRAHDVPLALDEEIQNEADALALIRSRLCDVLVLKPMILGGLMSCMRVVDAARLANMRVVYTSAWESDVGVAATLHLAAASGSVSGAVGLSTAGSIGRELVDCPLAINNARLSIGSDPGLGLRAVHVPEPHSD